MSQLRCVFLLAYVALCFAAENLPSDFFLDIDGIGIAPGHNHICVLERQPGVEVGGRPHCWGKNDHKKSNPPEEEIMIQIISGFFYSCGITLDQTVQCWGRLADTPVPGLYSQITGAIDYACGVMTDGKINCWGHSKMVNIFPTADYMAARGIEQFVQVSCHEEHCCALDDKGMATCWGSESYDELTSPIEQHLNADGEVVSQNEDGGDEGEDFYGFNEFEGGEAGTSGSELHSPRDAMNKVAFKQISAGSRTTCGIRYDTSDLMCWGNLESLYLETQTVPGPFKQVASGRMGVCALYDTEAMVENGTTPPAPMVCYGRARLIVPPPSDMVDFDQVAVSSMVCGVSMENSQMLCYGGSKLDARSIPADLEIA